MVLNFEITIPPTSNHRLMPVRRGNGMRLVKSAEYRQWMADAAAAMRVSLPADFTPLQECMVTVSVSFPDRRRRDLDNILKPLNDTLVMAGVIEDDSLIRAQAVTRTDTVTKGIGRVCVSVWPVEHEFNSALKEVMVYAIQNSMQACG